MSRRNHKGNQTEQGQIPDYEVGYARPPVATRFQAGGVGNPKGRPKKTKTVAQAETEDSREAVMMALRAMVDFVEAVPGMGALESLKPDLDLVGRAQ
jgi:Family of unknown function (DUF5681)